MRKLHAGLLLCVMTVTAASAAVSDTDSMLLLPAGTVLVLKKTVAIKPHETLVCSEPNPGDGVLALWTSVEASPRDRELRAGTRWNFERAEYRSRHYGGHLLGKTAGGTTVTFQVGYHGRANQMPTIGALKTFFDVELPSVDVIDFE